MYSQSPNSRQNPYTQQFGGPYDNYPKQLLSRRHKNSRSGDLYHNQYSPEISYRVHDEIPEHLYNPYSHIQQRRQPDLHRYQDYRRDIPYHKLEHERPYTEQRRPNENNSKYYQIANPVFPEQRPHFQPQQMIESGKYFNQPPMYSDDARMDQKGFFGEEPFIHKYMDYRSKVPPYPERRAGERKQLNEFGQHPQKYRAQGLYGDSHFPEEVRIHSIDPRYIDPRTIQQGPFQNRPRFFEDPLLRKEHLLDKKGSLEHELHHNPQFYEDRYPQALGNNPQKYFQPQQYRQQYKQQ